MPGFRWEMKSDLALCVEVCKVRPEKPQQWSEVADSLNKLFSTTDKTIHLKGRGCKDRLSLLLNKYKEDDVRSLKRSGTEEQFTELAQIWRIFRHTKEILRRKKECERRLAQDKRIEEKRKGEEIRQVAMQRLSRKRGHSSDSSPSNLEYSILPDQDEEEDEEELPVRTEKRSRVSMKSTVEMFATKFEQKMILKEKELELKKMELELQQKKWEVEEAERKQRMQLEYGERHAFFDLIKNYRS